MTLSQPFCRKPSVARQKVEMCNLIQILLHTDKMNVSGYIHDRSELHLLYQLVFSKSMYPFLIHGDSPIIEIYYNND